MSYWHLNSFLPNLCLVMKFWVKTSMNTYRFVARIELHNYRIDIDDSFEWVGRSMLQKKREKNTRTTAIIIAYWFIVVLIEIFSVSFLLDRWFFYQMLRCYFWSWHVDWLTSRQQSFASVTICLRRICDIFSLPLGETNSDGRDRKKEKDSRKIIMTRSNRCINTHTHISESIENRSASRP